MRDEPFDEFALTGRARHHVRQYAAPRFAARPEVAAAFMAMRAAAGRDGIDMLPIASWRRAAWLRRTCSDATSRSPCCRRASATTA